MAELQTITVRLKYSPSRAEANINEMDFDPALHARLDEDSPPSSSPPPVPSADREPASSKPTRQK